MKLKLQNLFRTILILALLLNSGAYVLLYISSTKIVKKTIHYLLENDKISDKLIILSISKKDISNKLIKFERIDNKEFLFNGDIYDIRNDLSDSDSLRFLCYFDEYENLLDKLFKKYSDSNSNKNSNNQNNIFTGSFLALYFTQTESINNFVDKFLFSLISNFKLIYRKYEVLTPPPELQINLN